MEIPLYQKFSNDNYMEGSIEISDELEENYNLITDHEMRLVWSEESSILSRVSIVIEHDLGAYVKDFCDMEELRYVLEDLIRAFDVVAFSNWLLLHDLQKEPS